MNHPPGSDVEIGESSLGHDFSNFARRLVENDIEFVDLKT